MARTLLAVRVGKRAICGGWCQMLVNKGVGGIGAVRDGGDGQSRTYGLHVLV